MVQRTRTHLTVAETRKIIINGQTISYIIKCSARAKHVRLEVRPETGLTVVIPKSYKIRQLPDLLEAKGGWVAEHCPRWREHKKWLKDHETELVAKLSL